LPPKYAKNATVVLMKNIKQKASNTDKQKTLALLRSVWLSYLLSLGSISTGALLTFSVAAILGTKPAQANLSDRSASLPDRTVKEESAKPASTCSFVHNSPADSSQDFVQGESFQTAEGDVEQLADSPNSQSASELPQTKGLEDSVAQKAKADAPDIATANFSTAATLPRSPLQDSCLKEETASKCQVTLSNSCTSQLGQVAFAPTQGSIAQIPGFSPASQDTVEAFQQNISTEFNVAPSGLAEKQSKTEAAVNAFPIANSLSFAQASTTTDKDSFLAQIPTGDESTTVAQASTPSPTTDKPTSNSVDEDSDPLAVGNQTTTVAQASVPSLTQSEQRANSNEFNTSFPSAVVDEPTTVAPKTTASSTDPEPAPYNGPGGAALLRGTIQAQSSGKDDLESTKDTQNAAQLQNPLAPSLVFQGGFITQGGDTGARARVTGVYPISPNALFGGTVDLTTGEGFSDSEGTGLDLNELYFTGSLPSYPNLRLTVGLMDLTSYFDRNSFAKDSLTHFFNPVFQTNPALAAAGIGSRPGVLLNWDISDNIQARAAAFSSRKNIGDFDLDAYAGELAFRYGNAIVRGTFVSDRDAGKNSGFEEIYGIPRGNNEFGLRSGDRENAYGVNAEYYIPEIKMGLFGRYGHYENTAIGKGGDTFSVGLNFLDLFMKDDRLGFGYGRNLSNNDLRRDLGNKVPDVWEAFYDFRITPYLRAGVTLQARDEFSDVVAGVRVKTEFDLLGIGRLFR
jgi:hypothetical protein